MSMRDRIASDLAACKKVFDEVGKGMKRIQEKEIDAEKKLKEMIRFALQYVSRKENFLLSSLIPRILMLLDKR